MHWIYLIVGGIYTSKDIPNRIKYIWIFSCAIITIVDLIGGLDYIATAEVVKPVDIISILYIVDGKLYFFIVLPLVTCRYHRELEQLFEYLERASRTTAPRYHQRTIRANSASGFLKRVDSVAAGYCWFRLILILGVCLIMVSVVDIYFFCDAEEPFRDLQHHVTLLPFMNHVPSLRVFWIVYAVESLLVLFAMAAGLPEAVLVSMIASEFNNLVVDFCGRMRMLTDFVHEESETRRTSDCSKTQSVFRRDAIIFIREYQKLIK